MLERPRHLVGRIDLARLEPFEQILDGEIEIHHLHGIFEKTIGHGFADRDARGFFDDVLERYEAIDYTARCALLMSAELSERMARWPDRGTASRRRHLGNFLLLGRQHVETGNWPEAIRLLLRALECDPHSVEALRMLAGVELSRGDAVAAQQYLSRALALAPDDAENLFLQGNLALNAQDAPTALTAYTRALDLGGATPELSYNCALAHLMLGHGAPEAVLTPELIASVFQVKALPGNGLALELP